MRAGALAGRPVTVLARRAVTTLYSATENSTVLALPREEPAQRLALNVLVAFLPAVVLGLLFGKAIKANLFNPVVVASTFIVGGLVILWAEKRQQNNPAVARVQDADHMTLMDALKVGLVQCLAMIPGTSRSGATIIGGMLLGMNRRSATEFSFFLAIPMLFGAAVYDLYKHHALLSTADIPLFAVGMVTAWLSAWVCVRWLLRFVSTSTFVPFAWYRIVFGVLILLTAWGGWVDWTP